MTARPQLLDPLFVAAGDGEPRWWFGSLVVVKLTAEQSGGLLTILEVTEPPQAVAPLHVHDREDEGFWVLDGEVTFEVGETTVAARAGDFAFGPRGIPHRYVVGAQGCRMLFVLTPGGFENLVRGMSLPAERHVLPPPTDVEPDWEHVAAVAEANECRLLG
jgi:quercetin dioxygenase-like cupin family protein